MDMRMTRNPPKLRLKWTSSKADSEDETFPDDVPQYFRVIVGVIKGKQLAWSHPKSATSYVIVVLNKKKQRTSVKRNMPEPYYRETFQFEVCSCIKDLHQAVLWFAVMESRRCSPPRLLGEAGLDLAAVWVQPHHSMSEKWAQLTLPKDTGGGPVGFLKVDISILQSGEDSIVTSRSCSEKLEHCLLLPSGSEQQLAGYQITVYGAYCLPSGTQCHGDKSAKPPSTFVRVTFCGLMGKTCIQNRNSNPTYSEQICMVEMFPNICQTVKFEVCCADVSSQKVLASTYLGFAQISHGVENGFLPTFGPSFLHMYGSWSSSSLSDSEDGPYYRGSLLLSLKTVVPYCKQPLRTVTVEAVTPLKPEMVWMFEDFSIYCAVFEVSMLEKRISVKPCGIAITMGEMPCDNQFDEEFVILVQEIRQNKLHYTGAMDVNRNETMYGSLEFEHGLPVLQLATRLPDFRFRMYKNNMVQGIVEDLVHVLDHIESRLRANDFENPNELMSLLHRALEDTAAEIQKFQEIIRRSAEDTKHLNTDLDSKQTQLEVEEMEKIHQILIKKSKGKTASNVVQKVSNEEKKCSKKEVKSLLAEGRALAQDLRGLIFKTSDGWPEIVIWELSGGSRVAYTKVLCADVLHSVTREQNGRKCGRIESVFLKPVKCQKHLDSTSCNCIAAKVELLLWMGPCCQRGEFPPCLPEGYTLRTRDCQLLLECNSMLLECRVNVFRAKLNCDTESAAAKSIFVRVNFMKASKDTQGQQNQVNPVWNELVRFNVNVSTTLERLITSPPQVVAEVFSFSATKNRDLIGRVLVKPAISNKEDLTPQLEWLVVLCGSEQTGQILISAQLLQSPEKFFKPTDDPCGNVNVGKFEGQIPEPIPKYLIPAPKTYKVDVYWWGLREVSITHKPCMFLEILDMTIKSGIITHATTNCNFPNGRISQIFEGNLTDCYCTPLAVKLYDSGSFGRTLFLGLNVVKNPLKYMIKWLPKKERQESIYTTVIMSPDFLQGYGVPTHSLIPNSFYGTARYGMNFFHRQTFHRHYHFKEFSIFRNLFSAEPMSISVGRKLVYVKKQQKRVAHSQPTSDVSCNETFRKSFAKLTFLQTFFTKENDEERNMLLPTFCKLNNEIKVVKKSKEDEPNDKDWWTRYMESQLASNSETNNSERITIYNSELECQPGFSRFKDWCSTLKLYNGKKTGIPEKDEQLHCGYLKVGIKIYEWPPPRNTVVVSPTGVQLDRGFFSDYPDNEPMLYLVRVYIVKASGLNSKDCAAKADPYVTVQCGRQMLGDRNSFVKRTSSPVFGKMYELRCTLPKEYLLKVSLYNFNVVWPDEMIGCTCIDLEDRAFSKHRPLVGLAPQYTTTGSTKWRDNKKPSMILEELCLKNHLSPPVFPDSATVLVSGVEYRDSESGEKSAPVERKENICLSLLHKWETLPICGHKLVPEHVETRTLYNPLKPGVVQGKIHLWVDMFKLEHGVYMPAPLNITPRQVEQYELRVVVWDVLGVHLRGASDIYVKGWIGPSDEAQDTDIHYQSVNGEGKFNWRMIFHFLYLHSSKKLVLSEKGPFTEIEEHVPPILVIQVQDSESPNPEDFLGTLMLDITEMPNGAKCAEQCTPDVSHDRKINLFLVKSTRAWWPLKRLDRSTGSYYPGGKIDMELTLLPLEKATQMPAGIGRISPMRLPKPRRKKVSNNSKPVCRCQVRIIMYFGVLFLLCLSAVFCWGYYATQWLCWTEEMDALDSA